MEAISSAKNLITLRLQTQWIPSIGGFEKKPHFTMEDARDVMLRDENSKLRVIAIGHIQYKVIPGLLLFLIFPLILCGRESGLWRKWMNA